MATRNSDLDLSLDTRVDYLFALLAVLAGLIALIFIVAFPLYVFYEVGSILEVGRPRAFSIGLYVIVAAYIWRGF